MLELKICIVVLVLAIFLFFVGMALESKLKAQAAFYRAEAQKSLSDAAYTRFQRERQLAQLAPRCTSPRGGLPESMLPRAFESSYPKV